MTGSRVTSTGLWMPWRTQEILAALGSSHLQRSLELYPRDPCFSLPMLLCPEYDLHCMDCSPCSLCMRRKHWWGRGNAACRQAASGWWDMTRHQIPHCLQTECIVNFVKEVSTQRLASELQGAVRYQKNYSDSQEPEPVKRINHRPQVCVLSLVLAINQWDFCFI